MSHDRDTAQASRRDWLWIAASSEIDRSMRKLNFDALFVETLFQASTVLTAYGPLLDWFGSHAAFDHSGRVGLVSYAGYLWLACKLNARQKTCKRISHCTSVHSDPVILVCLQEPGA